MQDYEGNGRVMHAILDDKAGRMPGKVFARFNDESITYGELRSQSERIAASLGDVLGVRKSETIAVFLPNRLEWLPLQFGVSRSGAVMAPLNTVFEKEILSRYLNTIEASTVVVDASLYLKLEEVQDSIPGVRTLIWVGPGGDEVPARFRVVPYSSLLAPAPRKAAADIGRTDVVDIFSTSGSTGFSKGVVLAHNHHYIFGRSIARAGRLGPDDVMSIMLPLCHGAGSFMSIMPALLCEGSIVISEGFSASNWLDDIRKAGATVIWTVASIAPILLKQPERPDDRDNPLKVYFTIGILPEVIEPFERRFGVKVLDCFGSTETGHIAYSIWEERRPGAVGPVNTADYEVRIVDENDEEVAPGEIGECTSRNRHSFSQMIAYYGMPAETLAIMGNRWIHSGDLCRVDRDGWLYFVGRKKDMIRRRGENISCHELETIMAGFEGVVECAAIGVPSVLGEEEVKVVIVPQSPRHASVGHIAGLCARNLPRHMRPRYIEFVAGLPRLANQKIDKQAMRRAGVNPSTWDVTLGALVTATGTGGADGPAMTRAGEALEHEFIDLAARLNASAPARHLMAAFPKVIEVAVIGDAGPFRVVFRDGAVEVRHGGEAPPDLALTIERGGRFREVLKGGLDITHTLASGELTVTSGKVNDLILFNRIIVAGLKK
ncbi:MAG: AMP-binding protein [Rhodobacteraceae bacterium]|nr:AMP-binding protein [Paracoccaceae bacterium]